MNKDILEASSTLETWTGQQGHNDTNWNATESLAQLIEDQFNGGNDLWGMAHSSTPELPAQSADSLQNEADAEFETFCEQLDAILDSGPLALSPPPFSAHTDTVVEVIDLTQDDESDLAEEIDGQGAQIPEHEQQPETTVETDVEVTHVQQTDTVQQSTEREYNDLEKHGQKEFHALSAVERQSQAPLPAPVASNLKRKYDGVKHIPVAKRHQADHRRDSLCSQISLDQAPLPTPITNNLKRKHDGVQDHPAKRHQVDTRGDSLCPQASVFTPYVPQQPVFQAPPGMNIHAYQAAMGPRPQPQPQLRPLTDGILLQQLNNGYSVPSPYHISQLSPTQNKQSMPPGASNQTNFSHTTPKAVTTAAPKARTNTKNTNARGNSAVATRLNSDTISPDDDETRVQNVLSNIKGSVMDGLQFAAGRLRRYINGWKDKSDKAAEDIEKLKKAKKSPAEEQRSRRKYQDKYRYLEKKWEKVRDEIETRGGRVMQDSDTPN